MDGPIDGPMELDGLDDSNNFSAVMQQQLRC